MKFSSSTSASSALLPLILLILATITSISSAQTLEDGLKIETTKPASCQRKSKDGDTLKVHYRGTLLSDGTEFDSSYSRDEPFQFVLGRGMVIQGWDKGLLDMCIGEGRKLTIPPGLAYKDRATGKIPANSVLVFETELLGIEGVEKETPPPAVTSSESVPTPSSSSNPKYSGNPHNTNTGHDNGTKGDAKGPKKSGSGECKLLGRFAILIQGALGGLALLALVWKRWRETPRRPVKIWFFDVSKQVVGSVLLHFANLFLSMLSSGGLKITNSTTTYEPLPAAAAAAHKKSPNPCSFYLLNLAIDTTIGIPLLVLFLRLFHWLFVRTPLGNPAESLASGNYGHPPQWRWWGKQALVYFLGLFAMKFCVFLLFQLFPGLGWVGDWALRWTEGQEWMQILFVMLAFPLIMNVAQYWIIDNFIKDPAGEYDYDAVHAEGAGSDDGSEHDGLMGRSHDSLDDDAPAVRRISPHGAPKGKGEARTKEANPLPLPVEFDDDEEEGHHGSRQHTD